jgi:hypothetical protein
MEPILTNKIKPTPNDNLGLNTTKYVNSDWGFDDLEYRVDLYPLINAKIEYLKEIVGLYYSNYNIVGKTQFDFFMNLQNAYNIKAMTLEKYLSVYNDIQPDYFNPDLKTVYNVKTSVKGNIRNDEMVITNNTDDYPTTASVSESENLQTGDVTVKDNTKFGRGIENTQDRLNKFISENKTLEEIFIDIFKDCFIIMDVITW